MGDETAVLRAKARAVIQAGRLPDRLPDHIWGGPGAGAECAICGVPVTTAELEYQIVFLRNGSDSVVDAYHVHFRCLTTWISERHGDAKLPTEQS